MTLSSNLTGVWNGTFKYGPEYGALQGKCVDFKLVLVEDNGDFTGISIDSESKDIFNDPIMVQGFWDNETISFIIQYPYPYSTDENGKLLVDKTGKPHIVIYTGYYDIIAECFIGDWDITVDSKKNGDVLIEQFLSGTWTMKRG